VKEPDYFHLEPDFHFTGRYVGYYGVLMMRFAVEELTGMTDARGKPMYATTVEVKNRLDFEQIRADASGMEHDRYTEDEDPMAALVMPILDAAMGAGDGNQDNPEAGGFAASWADDGSWIEIDYTPLSIRLYPDNLVRVTACD
jgi:hypothetical protein